jgi:nitrogen fixation protein FixH
MTTRRDSNVTAKPKELTGRFVLICFLGFFGVVVAMNAVLIRAATTTFGGVETASAYKAGLAFKREIAAAEAQAARHWTVDASLIRAAAGSAHLSVTVRDRDGAAPHGIMLSGRLAHPADARRDHAIAVRGSAPGAFNGTVDAEAGQWDLVLEISRDGERLFRSKSRVTLR